LPERSQSARSLLLTLLGEYVLPSGGPAWTTAFVDVLGGLGVDPAAARQALARTASAGWLAAERDGRRTRWRLTDAGSQLLSDGARRIYGFAPSSTAWDGRWLVLLASVPERRREARHALRTRLAWAGFGSPAPGVWISANAAAEADAKQVLAGLGLDGEAASFVGPFGGIGSAPELVARAWDLAAVARHYEEFLALVAGLAPAGGPATLLAQARLVHAWRRMPLIDPQLPAELLPPGWVGARAAEVFHGRHEQWAPAARRAFGA
jgi:phenylacetic acid degradation operon negative regulatory protein